MDEQLNSDALVELVHRYYVTHLYSGEPGYYESEQYRRLYALRRAAELERTDLWRNFLTRVRKTLSDCFVWDLSYLRHDNCHRVRVYVRGTTPQTVDTKAVMACISILAPVYVTYTSYQEHVDGLYSKSRTFYEPRPDTREVEEVVEAEIRSVFGFRRLPNGVLFTPVPDIQCGNRALGEATLADCLFTDDRW